MRYMSSSSGIFRLCASLALREHYRDRTTTPCSINSHWDCGIVNKTPYAVVGPMPVADFCIAGCAIL